MASSKGESGFIVHRRVAGIQLSLFALPTGRTVGLREGMRFRGRLRWTYHVASRLGQRALTPQMLVDTVRTFEILESYPKDKYLPSYLVRAEHGGVVFHAVIAADVEGRNIRIVTMYAPDPREWNAGFRERRTTP